MRNYYFTTKLKEFEYAAPKTIDDAVSILKEHAGGAKVFVGGINLVPALRFGVLPNYPELVVDIKKIPNLDYIKEEQEEIRIGALATLTQIANNELVKDKLPALAQSMNATLSPQVRNTSTIAGDICQELNSWYMWSTNPITREVDAEYIASEGMNQYLSIFGGAEVKYAVNISNVATVLMALNAKVKTSKREIPLDNFYTQKVGNTSNTTLDSDEVILEIKIPTPNGNTKQFFMSLRMRELVDNSLVSVAIVAKLDSSGSVKDCRIVLGAVAPEPWRAIQAEKDIKGKKISENTAASAGEKAVANAQPLSKNDYKVQIAKTLVKRGLLGLA